MNLRTDLRARADHIIEPGDYDRVLHIAAAEQIDELEEDLMRAKRAADSYREALRRIVDSLAVSIQGSLFIRHSLNPDDWMKWVVNSIDLIDQEVNKPNSFGR